jgi:hypothetical protein
MLKSDSNVLFFLQHMQLIDKKCGIIVNTILDFFKKYFLKIYMQQLCNYEILYK